MSFWSHVSPAVFDRINGAFEAYGAWGAWANFARLRRDKEVKGIVWQFVLGYQLWGVWNIWYYYGLEQWFSWDAGIVLCAGNTAWVITMARILHEKRNSSV